jgi:membrane associated rhomboid family serine protease
MVPIPLDDNVRRSSFWLATLALIIANVWMFTYELSLGHRLLNRLIFVDGIVPARYLPHGALLIPSPEGLLKPIFVSMFLHGGWLHLIGNMLFLYVFGRSVEDRFGHVKFLVIYFVGGFGGALVHIIFNLGSSVPSIGASGAIAGILGAYFVSFPRARITVLIWFIIFFWTVHLPALLVLGYWFLIQFLSGYQMMAIQSATQGGVAWWAHVGGFIVGMVLALLIQPRQRGSAVEVVNW